MYLIIAKADTDNRIDGYNTAETEERAKELQTIMQDEGSPGAFYVTRPSYNLDDVLIDYAAKTISEDKSGVDLAWAILRTKRNALLTESDWTQGNDSPLSDDVKASWEEYRQLLRDFPASIEDPDDPTWPSAPE